MQTQSAMSNMLPQQQDTPHANSSAHPRDSYPMDSSSSISPPTSSAAVAASPPSTVESPTIPSRPSLQERYEASMLLAACGDAMGYRHGGWEFTHSGTRIHAEMMSLTNGAGVGALKIKLPGFNLSDDTIMAIATAEGFLETAKDLPPLARTEVCAPPSQESKEEVMDEIAPTTADSPLTFHQRCTLIAQAYVRSFDDMGGRAPGSTTGCSIYFLERNGAHNWHRIQFSTGAGGCGAAMRSTPIGLVFPTEAQEDDLIAYAVETGRMTHHSAIGYLGSVAGALFTAFALRDIPPIQWGKRLLDVLPRVEAHLRYRGIYIEENIESMVKFTKLWTAYLQKRNILDGVGPPRFPEVYGVKERDAFYVECSLNGWGGATGTDAPMIAYDAYLGANGSWLECCLRGVLHGGDNDSTGVLIGGWYGAAYGFAGVPESHYAQLEYHDRMVGLARGLYERYHSGTGKAHEGAIECYNITAPPSKPAPVQRHWSDSSDAAAGGYPQRDTESDEESPVEDSDAEEDEEIEEAQPSTPRFVVAGAVVYDNMDHLD